MNDKDYNEMLDWLYSLKTIGIMPGLEKISEAMEKLGNPQDKLRIIHVAGTNGKGSVCAMLESILRHAGYKVGMFTSPHLVDFEERFQVDREKISREDAFRLVARVRESGVNLTFFELTTAVAFLHFLEKKVDYVVLEVGMGGRLDATNIVKPVATVITSISFDHTNWLGDTLDKIAYEKACIAKRGVPLFTPVVNDVIKSVCEERGAAMFIVTGEEETNMRGTFQKKNAAVAASVARHLKIPESSIKKGLFSVYWPARLEFIENNVLLDCGHNTDGIVKIAEFVKTLKYGRLIIIFGVMKDKDYAGMIKNLPDYGKIILTKPKIVRSLDPNSIVVPNSIIIEDVGEAYNYAKNIAGEKDLVLICGSCYLAGEFLARKRNVEINPIMFIQ